MKCLNAGTIDRWIEKKLNSIIQFRSNIICSLISFPLLCSLLVWYKNILNSSQVMLWTGAQKPRPKKNQTKRRRMFFPRLDARRASRCTQHHHHDFIISFFIPLCNKFYLTSWRTTRLLSRAQVAICRWSGRSRQFSRSRSNEDYGRKKRQKPSLNL